MKNSTIHNDSLENRITKALFSCMKQHGSIDEVSVAQIAEAANISRTTFYAHFDNKYEIVERHFDLIASTYLYQTGIKYNWFEANYYNSRELELLKDFYVPAFKSEALDSILYYARRKREETLKQAIRDRHHIEIDEELEFQILCYTLSETSAVDKWIKDGMPYSAKHLATLLDNVIPRRLYQLLNDPNEKGKSAFDFRDT